MISLAEPLEPFALGLAGADLALPFGFGSGVERLKAGTMIVDPPCIPTAEASASASDWCAGGAAARVPLPLPAWIVTAKTSGPTFALACVDRHGENERPDLYHIAILERLRGGDRLAVYQRPIAAAEIANGQRFTLEGKLGVFATDQLAYGPQVARLTAPDEERGSREVDRLAFLLSLDDRQLRFHVTRPCPDRAELPAEPLRSHESIDARGGCLVDVLLEQGAEM
jgi:hypothetical protein